MTRDDAIRIARSKMYHFVPMPRRPDISEAVFNPEGIVDVLVALGVLKLDEPQH